METVDFQNLQAIVGASDIAIRAASQLRQWVAKRVATDKEALAQAMSFLERASNGGSFMAGQQSASAKFGNSLQPLNWATDTYLAVAASESSSSTPNYSAIARYLEQLHATLKGVSNDANVDLARVKDAESFFDALGELLGSKADQQMRRESFVFDFGANLQ